MKFNFFDWIREGVRQSVLLGISDAAEQIGSQREVDTLNQRFLQALQENRLIGHDDANAAEPAVGATGKGRTRRKSLGRSLDQIIEQDKAA